VSGELVLRRAGEADLPGILAVARESLDWDDDERHEAFFAWKHLENPVGPSPMWVADDGGTIVAFRTFLRWEWRRPDGTIAGTVRAVDTATHPDHQGRGLFTALTMGALDELTAEGLDFVFNTPNDQSRPGYLKMGWQIIGRPPVRVRPRGLRGLARLARSRVPAEKWSEPATFGQAAAEAFAGADLDGVAEALTTDTLATNRTPTYLRWRYGFAPLHYRVVRRGDDLTDGFAVVRLRHRGAAVEGTVCELVVPGGDGRAIRHLLGQVEGADYLLVAGRLSPADGGLLPAPHQGPQVTWRALNEQEPPALRGWTLSLGDLELF
jgi:GNAT superfamily N-acetyltransferase